MFSSRKTDTPAAIKNSSVLESITRFWVTVIILLFILYAAFLFISRTAGFKDLVRQRVEILTGFPVTLDRVFVGPALELVVEGVSENISLTNRPPGLLIRRAEMYWRLMPLLRGEGWPFRKIKVSGCTLRFSRTSDGSWTPLPKIQGVLAPWVFGESITTNATKVELTEYLREVRASIDLDNVRIVWMGDSEDDPPLSIIEGLNFKSETVKPMDQVVLWCTLQIQNGANEGTEWIHDLDMEWIRMRDQDVVLRIHGVETPPSTQ